jgi:hypothetical protein
VRSLTLPGVAKEVTLDDDAIVIRFRPTSPDAVLRSVRAEHARVGHHGASCFASAALEGEDDEDVYRRLLAVAELGHIALTNNKNFYVCSRACEVTALGFVFLKDEESGELPDHYCADLGEDPTLDDVTTFLSVFSPKKTADVVVAAE